jgi:hypothetical protein
MDNPKWIASCIFRTAKELEDLCEMLVDADAREALIDLAETAYKAVQELHVGFVEHTGVEKPKPDYTEDEGC